MSHQTAVQFLATSRRASIPLIKQWGTQKPTPLSLQSFLDFGESIILHTLLVTRISIYVLQSFRSCTLAN